MKKKGNVFAKSTTILLVFILFFTTLTTFTKSATLNEVTSGVGGATGDRYGWNVSYAGDINGDGYDDIVVGAPYVTYNSISECGAVYIFFGRENFNPNDLNATNANVSIYGNTAGGHFGWSVSGAGKVNELSGGYDDIIIGEPDNGTGVAYIFLGRATASWSATYTTANANCKLTIGSSGDKFGLAVSNAGDVNNDGYDDVIIGAYGYGTDKGRAYVYYGGVIVAPTDSTVYVTSNVTTYGTIANFASAQSATDGGAYATLTEGISQVTYVGAGAGADITVTPPLNVAFPTGLQANDLLLMQITVRDLVNAPTTPSGWTLLYGPDATTLGRQWIFSMFATGTETGNQVVDVGVVNIVKIGRMYAFRNVALSSFTEGGGFGTGTVAAISAQAVTTTGVKRLAVSFVFVNDDNAVGSFTGETGGDWTEAVAEYTTVSGADGCIQLQNATMASAGTISGGSYAMAAADPWGVRAFALIPCFRLDIEFNTTSVAEAANYYLQLNYNVTSGENFDVFAYNGASWDDMGDLTSTTMTQLQITLNSAHRLGTGYVRVRFVGKNESGDTTSQDKLYIEYHRIRSYGTLNAPFSAVNVTLTGENDNDKFGFSVSTAGNVNGDSYDDVLVGAPGYDNGKGEVYVYYGYSGMGSSILETLFFDGFESGNFVAGGWAVSTDPQVTTTNVKTGTYSANLGAGDTVTVNYITKALDTTSKTNIKLYYSVATVGLDAGVDYFKVQYDTGAGFVDFTGSLVENPIAYTDYSFDLPPAADNNQYLRIRFYLYRSATLEYAFVDDVSITCIFGAVPNLTLIGETTGNIFGHSISGLGDVNNDNYDDIIVGAPSTANGSAYVVYGSSNMKNVSVSGWGAEKTQVKQIQDDGSGYYVDTGRWQAQSFTPEVNFKITKVSIYGNDTGTVNTPTTMICADDGTGLPDTSNILVSANVYYGTTWTWYDIEFATHPVLTAGTTYWLVIADASTAANGQIWSFKGSDVYPGGIRAYQSSGVWTKNATQDMQFRIHGQPATALPNVTLNGAQPGDKLGYSVSGGNITGDNYNDIVVGAPYNDSAGVDAGAVYVFSGSASLPSSISALDANYTNYGENIDDNFGFSVSSAGDVNNDDYDDVAVGAPYYGTSDNGKVYVLTTVALMNNPPGVSNLGVQTYTSSPGILNITNHTPTLNYTYTDPEADKQSRRNVSVYNITSGQVIWYNNVTDGLNTSGSNITITFNYTGTATAGLQDNCTYYFNVTCNDTGSNKWCIVVSVKFHMNTKPPVPTTPIIPANNNEVSENNTQRVNWSSGGSDAEGSEVKYEWEVDKPPPPYEPNFNNIVNKSLAPTTYTNSTPFNTTGYTGIYYWRVRSFDGYERSDWNGYWKFTVKSGNLVPTATNLGVEGFMDGSSGILNITVHTPDLNYTYTDPEGDSQSWRNVSVYNINSGAVIWYSNVSDGLNTSGSKIIITFNYTGTATAGLQDGCDYYFNVTCNDTGSNNWCTVAFVVKFHMNKPPGVPTTPVLPNNGDTDVSTTTTLNWTSVIDPEGSDITYYWYIDDNEDFSSLFDSGFTPLNTNTSDALSLLSGKKYYWRVRAWDGYEYGDNSTTWNFITIAGNNPPDPPTLTGPENNTWNNSATINFTWSYFDPEGNPQNGFNITISNNSDFSIINYTENMTSSNHYYEMTIENGTWYWKVKVNDTNHAWSKWSEWRKIRIDTGKPESKVDDISIYWHKEPVEITANSTDDNWVRNVTLYYYYSADNNSWDTSYIFGTNDTLTKINNNWSASWLFDFPKGEGYYRFYSIAFDNASNTEGPPIVNDTECGYDKTSPSISSLKPTDGSIVRNKTVNISAMLNDVVSGIKWSSVNVTIDSGTTNLWVENNKTKVEGGWKIWVDLSFSDGSHTVKVEVKSNASNTGIKTWSFTVDSSPITVDSITFSHYLARVGQIITIYVEVYNNGISTVNWNVNITANYGTLNYNGSLNINSNSTNTAYTSYLIPSDADGETITFTVRIYSSGVIDSQTATFEVASSFTGGKPVKSFDISLSMIFIVVVFAALLSLKGKHKRRKQS